MISLSIELYFVQNIFSWFADYSDYPNKRGSFLESERYFMHTKGKKSEEVVLCTLNAIIRTPTKINIFSRVSNLFGCIFDYSTI